MNVIDADLVKEDSGIRLNVTACSPTIGWSDVSLSSAVYVAPPVNGIQDIFLNGTPLQGPALTSIVMYPLSTLIQKSDWLQGVMIQNTTDSLSLTIRTPSKQSGPIGKDWIAVESAGLKGDKLILDVRYAGGCKQHSFQVNWDGTSTRSIPPQITLELSHNAHGDPCKALLSERLQFDLSVIMDEPEKYLIRVDSNATALLAMTLGYLLKRLMPLLPVRSACCR